MARRLGRNEPLYPQRSVSSRQHPAALRMGMTRDARLVLFDVISSLRCCLAYTSTAAWCLRTRDEGISALFPHPEQVLHETRQKSPHSSACVSFSTGCIDKGSHRSGKRPAIGPRKGLGVRASRGRPSPRPGFVPEALVSMAILWPHRPWGSVCQRPAREALGGDVPWSVVPGDACRSCQRQACLLELLPKCGEEEGGTVPGDPVLLIWHPATATFNDLEHCSRLDVQATLSQLPTAITGFDERVGRSGDMEPYGGSVLRTSGASCW
ncbi:hypothetical protein CSOJ01_02887 [Colletotrichum sojae]|uniref:Uncharacterized protein n=1 Tax=Colletotrichum sojae TaxID=2175907 RepID=A0A8H6JNY9_9PEZI|nr:hypothetical protein CSOJ01_02887 [Colletotrichum sojae]